MNPSLQLIWRRTTRLFTAVKARRIIFYAQMSTFVDDKSPVCIPFILGQYTKHVEEYKLKNLDIPPFFIGINGLQGVGKTTLVTNLEHIFKAPPYSLPVVVFSIDDLYLSHSDQGLVAKENSSNPLVQHRGEPGTHDMILARTIFSALKAGEEVSIPFYDKSQFNGAGDRAPKSRWRTVNVHGQETAKIIIFEGWCVGFRAISEQEIRTKYLESQEAAAKEKYGQTSRTTLWKYTPEDLLFVNTRLKDYDIMTDNFNVFVHLDALDTEFVYKWRQQQESELRARTGRGMSDEQVVAFVDGYYPAYELYSKGLREGVIRGHRGRQLRIVVNGERKIVSTAII
ncbi:P-loop containing nucleoside triphosphate hydrolase protein [Limtongia smithiae]|uniref:P-loop containing nucleoside triphosphate hydrolase protein n=1 Tax=Limtongia smithiae TaxID=1125753 RepID=UPI0034CE0418